MDQNLPRCEPPTGRARRRLRRAFVLLTACGLLVGQTTLGRADDDDAPDLGSRPHITVVGTATANFAPDRATLRVGIEARRPTASDAWQSVGTIAAAVVAEAKARGIKPENLRTVRYALAQRFKGVRQSDGSFEQVPDGYEANTSLELGTSDLDGVGGLAQALIAKGATTLNDVEFFNSHAEAASNDLRAAAVRDAHQQAEAMAKAGGVRLGQLLRVEQPHASGLPHPPMVRATQLAAVPVQPGVQSFSEAVEATYAIE